MKQKDIALILVIVFISGVLSLVVSNTFISAPSKNMNAAKVDPIDASFNEPSKAHMNDKSFNPTQLIRIEDNSKVNASPFRGQ